MKFRMVPDVNVAVIDLIDGPGQVEVTVGPCAVALDENGEVTGIEVFDTRQFGEPFDQAAAERAVLWVRNQLDSTAS